MRQMKTLGQLSKTKTSFYYHLADCDKTKLDLSIKEREIERLTRFRIRIDKNEVHYLLESECNLDYDYLINEYGVSTKKTKDGKMKELITDLRGYVAEHKSVIFTVALVLLADHFIFNGALRERVKALVEGLLKKAEDKIAEVK